MVDFLLIGNIFIWGICKIRGKIFYESFFSIIVIKINLGVVVDIGEIDKLMR